VSQCLKFIVTLKLTVSVSMPQIHCYLKADIECPNAANSLLLQSWRECPNAANSLLPQSWRWVSQCLKFIVTSKLTVSVPMPQIHCYLKADSECPNAAHSLLPQSWRWVFRCRKFIVTSKLTRVSQCRKYILPQSWRWVSQCRKFIVTSKLTVSVPMPQIHCYFKADSECTYAANSSFP